MLKKIIPFLLLVAFACLLPAVAGPLLLDDNLHLGPIINWLSDRRDTDELIFGNMSGPFGRPVSILSFLLNALTTGAQIWPMKLTNLLLHFAIGFCVAKLFFRLFLRDANLADNAKLASLAAAVLWLILPQHISTVFYLIQRMTMLATMFAVLACWSYIEARERMERNEKHAYSYLLATAVLAVLSVLSKETGLLVPFYCLLIECVFFQPDKTNARPKIIAWGFRVGVIYPAILAIAYLAFNPGFVLDGYIDRAYSMTERLMTQLPVLTDYVVSTFMPTARSTDLFNDDFPIVHSMASSEVILLLSGIGIILAAIGLRKKYPCFSTGIGLFFIGHLLESSIFSLEIYFTHRNYLPSVGLILAASGLVAGMANRYAKIGTILRRVLPLAYLCIFIAYAIASYNRAHIWSDHGALMTHAQIYHPTSSRLRSELLLSAMSAKRLDIALQQADMALKTVPPNERRTIQLWKLLAYCYVQKPMPETELQALRLMPAERITIATSTALGYVSAAAEANSCPGLDRKELGIMASHWAINTVQPANSPWVWNTHLAAARLLASSGDLDAGLKQAQSAFQDSGYAFHTGILALQLANSLEDRRSAEDIEAKLLENESRYSQQQQSQLGALRKK